MPRTSPLSIDPSTHLPVLHSFGELSQFLRNSVADEDSRQMSESMGQLSMHIEGIIDSLRVNQDRNTVAPQLVDFLTVLREHRNLVVNLALPWRALYEYAAYLQALNNFRVLLGQWLLAGGTQSADLLLTAEDFELVAWRTLGEGVLLIDMYEECVSGAQQETSSPGPLEVTRVARALQWWNKLRR